jgi:twitching motility protein PilT
MIDVFPAERQTQVRVQLSNSLIAVFSQTLVPKKNPKPNEFGRVHGSGNYGHYSSDF